MPTIFEKIGELDSAWKYAEGGKLSREFRFDDFKKAMEFVNKVAEHAEELDHHPDLHVFYTKVIVEMWTHEEASVTDRDVALAKQIDKLVV